MMQLEVKRTHCGPLSTLGELYIDGVFECYTLEPPIVGLGWLAIGPGEYDVEITLSRRFRIELPLIRCPEPGIRMHPGVRAADTHGCLLVGQRFEAVPDRVDWVLHDSRAAFEPLFDTLRTALKAGPVTIKIGSES